MARLRATYAKVTISLAYSRTMIAKSTVAGPAVGGWPPSAAPIATEPASAKSP